MKEISNSILERIDLMARSRGLDIKAILVGSAARDTWLAGDHDLDIFLGMPESSDLGVALQLAREVAPVHEEKYAEHAAQLRPRGRPVSRSTLSYGLRESSENCSNMVTVTSASTPRSRLGGRTATPSSTAPRDGYRSNRPTPAARRSCSIPADEETPPENPTAWVAARGSAGGRKRAALSDRGLDTRRDAAKGGRRAPDRRRRKKFPLAPIFLLQSRQNIL